MNDIKISVCPDDEVGIIAVVLVWNKSTKNWNNCGIVVNNKNPEMAFKCALEAAKKYDLWEKK